MRQILLPTTLALLTVFGVAVGSRLAHAEPAPVDVGDAGVVDAPPTKGAVEPPSSGLPASPPAAAASPAPVAAPAKSAALLSSLRQGIPQDGAGRARALGGCVAVILLALAFSTNRRAVSWRVVVMGTLLQVVFALIVLKTDLGRGLFAGANDVIGKLLSFSEAGSRFVFGNLADNKVPVGVGLSPSPNDPRVGFVDQWASVGSMIAFRVLPTILFFSAITAVLYHLGILQRVVRAMAWVMQRSTRTSGAESLSAAANIFVGQTEAPLLVRPYLERMTKSELMCVMSGGFATVAGGVMAAYVAMLSTTFPDIAGHLLAASVMSAPAALVMAKILVPEVETPDTARGGLVDAPRLDANVIDAATRGTSEGLSLALNVAAMLISFLALIALLNAGVGVVGGWFGRPELTLELAFGRLCAPLAFALGTPWSDAVAVGQLIGTKTVVNEFVAYTQLAGMLDDGTLQHGVSVLIAVYALCGFSNFGSIGIQIGGLAALAPSRRSDLARLGLRAMAAGSLACFQTAAVAALVI